MPIDQAAIEDEILHGLKNEAGDLEERRRNALYFEGDFREDTDGWDFPEESLRTSMIMRRVVEVLTANLYRAGPVRTIPGHAAATAFLQEQYRRNQVDALWQAADQLSMVNEVAAFEVFGNTGEDSDERPIGFNLWGGEQLVAWCDPDNARRAAAVATIDKADNRRRIRLWTAAERVTYATAKWNGETAGGTAYREVDRIDNPYGCIPFAFVHTRFPARHFWSGGPGCFLRKLNFHVNWRLTRSADDIDNNRPIRVAENVPSGWNFPEGHSAGETVRIPADADAGGNGPAADARLLYITCDLGYLGSDWEDLRGYLEHGLEMLGVPYSAVRMEQLQAASGISLVAEQIPIVLWAQSRQRPFSGYEGSLARVALKVAAGHAKLNKRASLPGATVAQLEAAAKAELTTRYPEMSVQLPGPDRDLADGWLLDRALTSRVELLMKREGLTREEAVERLRQIAADRELEQELLGPPELETDPAKKPPGEPGDDEVPDDREQDDEDLSDEDDEENTDE